MFWVSLGNWDEDYADGTEEKRRTRNIKREMEELANHFHEDGMSFKTESLDEAREVKKKAQEIMKKYYPDNDAVLDQISISTQPECPECGTYARFSDNFCPDCGRKLIESKNIE
jgi:ribosomal protein L32